jgi:hypothetical protein
MWSPSGNFVSAKRCPILDFKPRCFGSEDEIVLINVDNGVLETLDLSPISNSVRLSQPIAWSPDGTELLILITEQIDEGGTENKLQSRYISYAPATSSFRNLDTKGTVIAWGVQETSFLIRQRSADNRALVGWYDVKFDEFTDLISIELEVGMADYYLLSPNQGFLLRANSLFPEDCETITVYSLEVEDNIIATISDACFPAWSSDSTKIAYSSKEQNSSPSKVIVVDSDGSNPQLLITNDLPFGISHPAWSPDSERIAVTYGGQGNTNSIHIVEIPSNIRP